MTQTVIGIFDSALEAQEANSELLKQGFRSEDVDISTQNNTTTDDSATMDIDTNREKNDGIGGFFRSLFNDDDDEPSKYEEVARRGTVVTVHAQSGEEASRASEILDDCGAVDVDERASQYRNTNYGEDTGMNTNADSHLNMGTDMNTDFDRNTDIDQNTNDSVKIIEEDLQVGKKEVETGGLRLRSRIIERPVEESVRLRSEHVTVDRNPVNRIATEADLDNFKEGTVEMTEHAEVPVINKEARVVEEITLNKDVEETDETISETVRRTDVEIEDLDSDEEDYTLRKKNQDLTDRDNLL